MEAFVSWFREQNGAVDTESLGLIDIPGQGTGAVALRDIPEGYTLFDIPRLLTLSTRTSSLPSLVGKIEWKRLQLNKGWVGLILCMMWEEAQGAKSKWANYLRIMPSEFDTPMFWSSDELKELDGTAVVDKVGKEDAERDYRDKLFPALQSRPDLFDPSHLPTHYSLENYHIMGSRILSRSFIVERWEGEEDDHEDQHDEYGDGMDVDENDREDTGAEGEDEDSDEEDDPSDVTMVPMADMLNARYGSENAKLFYEPTELKMVTTKPIKSGEQIYNTYGDPPNSELLRRYGHVDLLPLSSSLGDDDEGNPADLVEIPADLVLGIVADHLKKGADDEGLKERIDWWLEEGGDDSFVLETNFSLPLAMVSFIKLLLYSTPEWEKARDKGKPPKPKLDKEVLPLASASLTKRLEKYPTTLEDDFALLRSTLELLSRNKRRALIVRIGEKRILTKALERLVEFDKKFATDSVAAPSKPDGEKRKRMGEEKEEGGKRSKR